MATRTRLDSAQAMKQKAGTDAGQGKRTTGTISRSSTSAGGGKSTGSATPQRSPNNMKSTQSASRADQSKTGKKEPGVGPTKPTPAPSKRQSADRAPPGAQTQRVLSTGQRERSVTVKSPSHSSPSKTTPSRAEVGKSKTTAKPTASTKAASGSGSRSGSVSGRTVKKSSTPSPSRKPERTQNISDAIEAEPEKSQVIVDEETLTPPPPQPTIDDHSKFEVEDEPFEHDALTEEESQIHNEEYEEKAEEEEEDHESTLQATHMDEEESSKETEAIEVVAENHHDTVFEKPDENYDLTDIHHENHDREDEAGHQDMPDEEGSTTKSPTEQTPLEKIEPAAEVVEKKPISSPDTMKEPKTNFIEGTGDSNKIEAKTFTKSTLKPQIRAQNSSLNSSSGKKDSPVYNDMLKEATGKLLEKRKNRVSALVGAFETVISLQEPDA